MVVAFAVGERLMLRKKHPCGGFEWEITRLGADIGIRCAKCSRHVMMARSVLEKRMKTSLSKEKAT